MPVGEIQFWAALSQGTADSPTTPRRLRAELYAQGPAAYYANTIAPNLAKFATALGRDPTDLFWLLKDCWGRPNDGLGEASALWPDASQRAAKNDYWVQGVRETPHALRTLRRTYPTGWIYNGKPEQLDTSIFAGEGLSIPQYLARAHAVAAELGLGMAWDATAVNNTWYQTLRDIHDISGSPLGTEPFVAKNTGWTADTTVTGFVLGATVRNIIASGFSGGYANTDQNHLCKMAVLLESAASTTQGEVADWRSRNWDVYIPMDATAEQLAAFNVYP